MPIDLLLGDDPGPPRRRLGLRAIAAVFVLVLLGMLLIGAVVMVTAGERSDAPRRSERDTTRSVQEDQELDLDEEPTVTSAPAPAPTLGATSTAVPVAAPAPVDDITPAPTGTRSDALASFVDPAHRVQLVIPPGFSLVTDFDGSRAAWSGGGVTLQYLVDEGASVGDALAHRDQAAGGLAEVTYLPDPADAVLDGRYVVAGTDGEGNSSYERGRIRCGDLVRYRFEWAGGPHDPVVEAAAEALVSPDERLDSMGGVHATC